MNEKLKELIEANKDQLSGIVENLIVNASVRAIDDYVADLKPGNPYNPTDEGVETTKEVIRGHLPSAGTRESKVADGQIEKQFNIAAGKAPEQNFKRAPA